MATATEEPKVRAFKQEGIRFTIQQARFIRRAWRQADAESFAAWGREHLGKAASEILGEPFPSDEED